MALRAADRLMRAGQREPRARMVEARPRPQGRGVALDAVGREAARRVIGIGR